MSGFDGFMEAGRKIRGEVEEAKEGKPWVEPEPIKKLTPLAILRQACIDSNYRTATINDFKDIELEVKFPNEHGLYIHGNVGVGKTHYSWGLLKRLAVDKFQESKEFYSEIMLKGAINSYIYFARSSEIMDNIYGTFDGKGTKASVIKRFVDYPVLIIDDLSAQQGKSYYYEIFLSILDERMSKQRVTIITSNLNKGAIELKDERLGSRLKLLATLFIGGIDRRENQ